MKITSFILSLIVLFQSFNFDFDDFSKVPNFIRDVSCHIEGGENFTDFIADHYGEFKNSHEHKGNLHEHEEHGELPFKHEHADAHFQLVFVFFANEFETNFEELVVSNNNFNYREPSSNQFSDSLFQPPRV